MFYRQDSRQKHNSVPITLLGLILCIGAALGFTALDADAEEKITRSVYMSEWNAHLADRNDEACIYYGLLDAVDDNGDRLYSDEFIIGFLANIESEGYLGVVEYAFSREHAYDFALPSGRVTIGYLSDINYLMEWTTSDEGSENGIARGSCGVSSVQWSYGRRLQYLERLKNNLEGRYVVTKADLANTDIEMILYELEPGSKYYKAVTEAVGENATASDYAEAFCDYYFKPKSADFDMSRRAHCGKYLLLRRWFTRRLLFRYKSFDHR